MKTMSDYTIYCTPEQTERAYKLGAPIEKEHKFDIDYIPTFEIDEFDEEWYNADVEDYNQWVELIGDRMKEPKPIKDDYKVNLKYVTAEQMIGWLEEQGLAIDTEWSWGGQFTICVWYNPEKKHVYTSHANSRKEATLAAIDAALEYLEQQKKTIGGASRAEKGGKK